MTAETYLDLYSSLANRAWQRMVNLVGVHTVMVLVQRAVWLTRQKYVEAEMIGFSEAGISFDELQVVAPEQVRALVEEFISSLMGILTSLVGKEITQKLVQEIDEIIGVAGGASWSE